MCTGRVDLSFVLRAFQKGADGVIIGGCWLGECHYVTEGNYDAYNMMHLAKKLLEHTGVEPERLRLEWISAAEGNRFAEIMNDFTEQLRELGPLANGNGLAAKLEDVSKAVPYIKLIKKEKLSQRLENEDAARDFYTIEEIEALFDEMVSYHIDPEKCQACLICGKRCPVDGIVGGKNTIHVIDQEACIRCGTCYEACPTSFEAEQKIVGAAVPAAIPEEARTIVRKSKKKKS